MLVLDTILVQPITSGGVNATSAVTSLGSATTAGNTLLVFATTYGTTGITTPSGYTRDTGVPSGNAKVYVFRKSNIGASETLPTLATGASTQKTSWFALEVLSGAEGLDLTAPLDIASAIATATAQTIATVAVTGISYDAIAFTLFLAQDATSTSPPTWTWTSATVWQEVAEQGAADATTATGAMLACLSPLPTLNWPTAGGTSSLAANGPLAAVTVKYQAAGSKQAPDYRMILGFEWGTSAGLVTGMDIATAATLGITSPPRLLETKTGTVAVTSSTPRTGTSCLEIGSGSSAVHNATAVFPASSAVSVFYPFRFATLPATDTEIFKLEGASGVHCVVRFIAATSQVGVKIGTATEQVSNETIAAGSYHTLDLQYDMRVTNALAASWRLNGLDQPQATHATAGSTNSGTLRLGWSIASAAVMRVDDVIVAGRGGNWPLGDHKVVLVGVDPAGTLSISGTSTNFNVFSSNGTMAAWDAATAKTNISEGPPPTIGASAAGIAQVTTANADYVRIPMDTHTAAANEAIRAVRMLACGWAAGTQAKTLAFRAVNTGVETITVFGANDPESSNSTTDPAWVCGMVNPTGGWTQAWLDALEIHMGGSTDATPDLGIHWVGVEVAVAVAPTTVLFGDLADKAEDVLSQAVLGITVTTPPGKAADLYYEIGGTPTTVPIAADDTYTETLGAADAEAVNYIALYPDPEP